MNIAFLFPGQGSQYPGMGRDFVAQFPAARLRLEEAEDLLKMSLGQLLFEGPEALLTETRYSQLAIYTVNNLIAAALNAQFPEIKPAVCAGHSLGEYSALTVAGYLTFPEGLELVRRRGQLMHDACQEQQGGMAAIIGLSGQDAQQLVETLKIPNDLWVANYNCPGQVVISGTKKGIEIGSAAAKEHGAKGVIPLRVQGPFHSGLMWSAQDGLAPFIEQTVFHQGRAEVVMNISAQIENNSARMKELLIKQITGSVRWEESMRTIEKRQVALYVEVGCGKPLAGFNKRIGVLAPTISLDKIGDFKQLEEYFTDNM